MIVYAGQDKTNDNWVWCIEPTDDRFYNIKTIEWQPKSIEDIEIEYGIKVVVE